MGRYTRAAAGAAFSLASLALSGRFPEVAVLGTFAGAVVAVLAANGFNTSVSRALSLLAGLAHAAAVYHYTGSPWLAAAVMSLPLVLPPRPFFVRRLGYSLAYSIPLSAAAGALLTLADWPPRAEWWAVGPMLVTAVYLAGGAVDVVRRLMQQGRASWELAPGDSVPEIEMPARGGGTFRLSDHRGRFVFIHFMRSDWCPLCQVMLRVLKNAAKELEERNAVVVIVSPNEGDEAEAFARDMGLDYIMVEDPAHEISRRFGAFDPESYGGKGSPLPVGFLIGPDGKLKHASKPSDVGSFLDPDEVLRILRAA